TGGPQGGGVAGEGGGGEAEEGGRGGEAADHDPRDHGAREQRDARPQGLCLVPSSVEPPAWAEDAELLDPRALLAAPNGLLDLGAATAGRIKVLPPNPSLFNLTAVDFDFNPAAPRPERWLQFLDEVLGGDAESIAMIGEWAGYCLVADTSQQAMLWMI